MVPGIIHHPGRLEAGGSPQLRPPPPAGRRDAAKPAYGTYTYQNDVLGNRTWRNYGQSGVQRYIWDEVNRLKSLCGTSEGARYEYRADGMRVKKITDLTISWNPNDTEEGSGFYDEILSVNKPTTRYFYDGQMPMEEDFKITGGFGSPTVTVTQYGLGARGIDWIRNKVGNDPETVVFPIYDGHGNMVYTLSRGANETFSLGNKRVYGAWGDLRYDGNPGDGPNTQYCANLGHKKDGETDLIYMRARYYEPWTGRFISEDPARRGVNWFAYTNSSPVTGTDPTGKATIAEVAMNMSIIGFLNSLWSMILAWIRGESIAGAAAGGFITGAGIALGPAGTVVGSGLGTFINELMNDKSPGSAIRRAFASMALAGFGIWGAARIDPDCAEDFIFLFLIELDAGLVTDVFAGEPFNAFGR